MNLTTTDSIPAAVSGLDWFCLRSQPKHEHIAAARLRQFAGVEVFCPRLRARRPTRRGAVWFVEAMFPGYLFARFSLLEHYRRIKHSPGVTGILQFGQRFATLADEALEPLRERVGETETIVVNPEVRPGDAVQIVEGAFRGLEAVVLHVLPTKARLKVLLDFLGRSIEAEIHEPAVLPRLPHPLSV